MHKLLLIDQIWKFHVNNLSQIVETQPYETIKFLETKPYKNCFSSWLSKLIIPNIKKTQIIVQFNNIHIDSFEVIVVALVTQTS